MPLSRALVGGALLMSLAGCSYRATRYTWTGNEAQITQAHAESLREMQKEYVPVVAAKEVLKTAVPRSWVPVAV
jgi:hypothetical protein